MKTGDGKQVCDTVLLIQFVQIVIQHAFISEQCGAEYAGIGCIIYAAYMRQDIPADFVKHLRDQIDMVIGHIYVFGKAPVCYPLGEVIESVIEFTGISRNVHRAEFSGDADGVSDPDGIIIDVVAIDQKFAAS